MSYRDKDAQKSRFATQFIGRGAPGSSTDLYRKQWEARGLANTGEYRIYDMVFISVNGNRQGRIKPDLELIRKAVEAGATLITDNRYHRNRPYNVGEREVAEFLLSLECVEVECEPGSVGYGGSMWDSPKMRNYK
jgi:hypothetical protein